MAEHEEECPEIGPICEVRAEPPQRHHTTLLATDVRLFGELGLTQWLAAQAVLPLRIVGTATTYTDLSGQPITLDYTSIHHRNETLIGPGDALLLLHGGLRAGTMAMTARAGVSVPLGVVHENPYALGAQGLPHEHIQLGTGTWDPILGADVSGPIGGFALAGFAGLQAPLYQGPQGYQAGLRSHAGVLLSRVFDSVTARLSAQILDERPERWNGQVPTDDGNQGRTDLYLGPGVTWNFSGEWMLNADLRVRAWSHVVGAQLEMPLVLELGVGRLFHLEAGFEEQPDAPGDVLDLVRAGEAAPLDAVAGKWTVFDFWADWCEACKGLEAKLRALASQRPGLAVRRVNIVDFDSPIARSELPGVTQLPHLRVIRPGGGVAWEASGPADELFSQVERLTSR